MVHCPCYRASVLGDVLVRLDLGSGCDLLNQMLLEGALLGNFSGPLDTFSQDLRVIAVLVLKVLEVQQGLVVWVSADKLDAADCLGSRNVRRHADGVLWCLVALLGCTDIEGGLVDVEHEIRSGVRELLRVGRQHSQEESSIGHHRRLLCRRVPAGPHDDGLWMVSQVLTHTRQVQAALETELLELCPGADLGMHQQTWGVDGAGAQDDFLASSERLDEACLGSYLDTLYLELVLVIVDELLSPSLEEQVQVVPAVRAVRHNRVHVGYRCTAAVAGMRVVGDVEESDGLVECSAVCDLSIEVVDDGCACCRAGGLDPVSSNIVTVLVLDRDGIDLQAVSVGLDLARAPIWAAVVVGPVVQVLVEGPEGDEGIVRGAATKNLGTTVLDS